MKRFFNFQKLRIKFAAFALALLFGLWTGGFFEHYVFGFYVAESFSRNEAQNLIGKRVEGVCASRECVERKGVVIGYTTGDFGDIYVQIDWQEGYGEGVPKSCFKRYVKVVDSE